MSFKELFSKDYLFSTNIPRESKLYIPLLVLFGFLILVAIAFKFVRNPEYKKILNRYFVSFLTIGILGLIYLFCRYEALPGLNIRFFLLLILSSMFIWIAINSIWLFRFMPKYKKKKKVEDRYNKYLPKNKRVSK